MNSEVEKLHNSRRVWTVFSWSSIALAAACMLGVIVTLVMIGLHKGDIVLVGALLGGFTCGVLVFSGFTVLTMRAGSRAALKELDALERADSEFSFFIGEGTLATFDESRLVIHSAENRNKRIFVPYSEMKFFSVCTRRAPRERGEWSVVMQIPAHYLAKNGRAERNAPPALVQTDGKARLYACLEKFGLTLEGEKPKAEQQDRKFTLIEKFKLPDPGRKRNALLIGLGVLLLGGGIGAAFWQPTVGAVTAVLGLYIITRALVNFIQGGRTIAVFEEGIFWREQTAQECAFLKTEELEKLTFIEQNGDTYLRAQCAYGAYNFPCPSAAYELITKQFPDKCED